MFLATGALLSGSSAGKFSKALSKIPDLYVLSFSHLELSDMPFDSKKSRGELEYFVSNYLCTDGIFALRMVKLHAGVIFTTELITELWKIQSEIEKTQRQIAKDPIAVSLRNLSTVVEPETLYKRKSTHV